MNFREPGIDPEFEWLRRGHRSERAPDALRRRALSVAPATPTVNPEKPRGRGWLARGWPLALAATAAASVWLGVSRYAVEDGPRRAGARPTVPIDVVPGVEPSTPRNLAGRVCPEPLPTSPWNLAQIEMGPKLMGFEAVVFEDETHGCGPLTRRYVIRMPAGNAAAGNAAAGNTAAGNTAAAAGNAASAPLLIVLHDHGESGELAQIHTRWWFNDLARREGAVVVYANGATSRKGANVQRVNSGVWQVDEDAHPAVDDVEYLQGIVDDVRNQRGLAPTGDVYLAGYGSGGVMALAAAVRHPERYSGVAAFVPKRPPSVDALLPAARLGSGERRLNAVFLVLPQTEPSEDATALAGQWASALESVPALVRVTQQEAGIERVDASLTGGVALRILRLAREVDPFPLPGGDDPTARAASEERPFFFDGPGAAWAFLRQRP